MRSGIGAAARCVKMLAKEHSYKLLQAELKRNKNNKGGENANETKGAAKGKPKGKSKAKAKSKGKPRKKVEEEQPTED